MRLLSNKCEQVGMSLEMGKWYEHAHY